YLKSKLKNNLCGFLRIQDNLKKIIIYIQQEYSKLIHLHDEQILLVIINEPTLKSNQTIFVLLAIQD
ncbi:hypothetical protein, partial [Moraxella sp. RCAD0137]|uniref:hypothetical protein n=1 Tax=Moraxella sp. RCAD0137 TaxID=1775913 RepID=UPI001D0D4CFD